MNLVYLHGFASSPRSKKAQFFAARFAELGIGIEIPDLAEERFENLTITGQLRVVEKAVGGRSVCLMGSSLGGYLAALYAARHPEQVPKVVLLAPAFAFTRRWPESLGSEAMEGWRRTGFLPVQHYGDGATRQIGYQLIEDGLGYEEYPNVDQPALVFHGRQDTVVPPSFSVRFAAGKPNVQLRIMDSDHELIDVLSPMWRETSRFLLGGAAVV